MQQPPFRPCEYGRGGGFAVGKLGKRGGAAHIQALLCKAWMRTGRGPSDLARRTVLSVNRPAGSPLTLKIVLCRTEYMV